MALDALQLGVRSQQREVRVLSVIKSPQRPAIRRMTGFAFLTEPAFVHIIMRMTIDARRAGRAERQRRVALRTTGDSVQPEQREGRQIVIKTQLGAPRILAVTGLATA